MKKKTKCCKWLKKEWKTMAFWMVFAVIIFFAPKIFFLNFEKSEHLGFLGGYIGAVLTLVGVWIQIYKLEQHRKNDEEKKERKSEEEKSERERERKLGILKYLEFVLEENSKGAKENGCAYTMQANLLYSTSWNSHKEESEMFTKFKNQFIDNNLSVIMEFEKNIGKDVLKMERLIREVSDNYNYLLKNKKKRKVLFKSLKGLEDLKEKEKETAEKIISIPKKITQNECEEKMKHLMGVIRRVLLQTRWGEKSEEMWEYHILDKNLNGKGFEIIDKSEKLLEKVKEKINGLG